MKFKQFLQEAEKSTKAEANYQDSPKAGKHCSECTMWRPPHGCTGVSGVISSNGWCKYFEDASRKKDHI